MVRDDAALPNRLGPFGDDPILYQACLRPEAIACVDPARDLSLTYRALDRAVAAGVAILGGFVGALAATRIAVLARNSLEQVVLSLACQRAGVIFVPLNWRLAAAELTTIIADCRPACLFVTPEFSATARQAIAALPAEADLPAEAALPAAAALPAEATQAVRLADLESVGLLDRAGDAAADLRAPLPSFAADLPATLLYTSGTTGAPKGVVVTRAGAFFSALNFAFVGEVDAGSVLMSDLPMFHTVGLFAVMRTALTIGAKLVVSDRFIPAQTAARLADRGLGVTHYFGVPQIATQLRQDPAWRPAAITTLKAFFTGGAPLPPSLVEAYLDEGIMLVNGYGMSEAGTVLHMPLDRALTRRAAGAVGRPAPGVEVRIVDAAGQDVADGQTGEVLLRGPAVTPGYWRREDLTAAAFMAGWLRSGDMACRGPDGLYRLIDRRKDMYISGGENVYPAEVEAVLVRVPEIEDVAVVGMPHPRWGECGIACLILRSGAVADPAALAGFCARHLARYKVPAEFRVVASIPRTASGKIRKDELRRLLAAQPNLMEHAP